ncbi:MAG: thioredoxin domain-containing protein [Acidobacteria bacterium]|nr:thioredoxin domain-containing protein [Acidobacteriota bacterium]
MPRAFYSVIALLLATLLGLVPAAPAQSSERCVGGKAGAPVKIEVFSDYQCPGCRAFYLETMRSVLSNYADAGKVCVIYREFPLTIHPYAREAARYGHAAQRLGQRYWAQVTDALYLSQDQWAQDGKLEPVVAGALSKTDLARLQKEMVNPAIDAAISSDIALAKERKVDQTPTFFITANGKTQKISGVVQYPILRRCLDSLFGNGDRPCF